MKNIFKLNNKGFVLAETLVVAVSIVAIFTIIFRQFYPIMGEYERRDNYDDIDSKYGTYWFKKMVQSADYNRTNLDSEISTNGYSQFKCSNINNDVKKAMCYQMLKSLEVSCDNNSTNDRIEECTTDESTRAPHIYITSYKLEGRKERIKSTVPNISSQLVDYLDYLPEFRLVQSLNNANYRIIIEYYRHRFDTDRFSGDNTSYIIDTDNDYRTFGTIEVK